MSVQFLCRTQKFQIVFNKLQFHATALLIEGFKVPSLSPKVLGFEAYLMVCRGPVRDRAIYQASGCKPTLQIDVSVFFIMFILEKTLCAFYILLEYIWEYWNNSVPIQYQVLKYKYWNAELPSRRSGLVWNIIM